MMMTMLKIDAIISRSFFFLSSFGYNGMKCVVNLMMSLLPKKFPQLNLNSSSFSFICRRAQNYWKNALQ